jgi:hypothetical protein
VTDFATAADRLLTQVRHWEQPRWSAAGRADRMHALIQLLADLAADAEQRPRRPVPREHDMILPDQLRVMVDDLVAAGPSPEALSAATTAVTELRGSL